jgi:hypothetical protein
MVEQGRHRTHQGSQARGAPIDSLVLFKALATALEEALALALLELQFVAH